MTLLPLFPLPSVVLFPGALLPLHIFEARYREMIADALDGDRLIGMVLLQPGWETDYEGRPPVFPIGCSGVIVHSAKLEDGRYNIVLRGLDRFRIVSEDHTRAYRLATVEVVQDPAQDHEARITLRGLRARLAGLLGTSYADPLSSMPDADLVHTVAQALDLEPLEKQALLERDSLCGRAESLVDLLEMKRLRATLPAGPDRTH